MDPQSNPISKRGFDETLTVPQQYKDNANVAMNRMNMNFRTINGGLISVARNVGKMYQKINCLENTDTNVDDIKCRIRQLENTANQHTQLLNDIFSLLKQATMPEDEDDDEENEEENTRDEVNEDNEEGVDEENDATEEVEEEDDNVVEDKENQEEESNEDESTDSEVEIELDDE